MLNIVRAFVIIQPSRRELTLMDGPRPDLVSFEGIDSFGELLQKLLGRARGIREPNM